MKRGCDHVITSVLRQRSNFSLADQGWKARKRQFQTGVVTERHKP
jgi:hypothetical protein